jgi:hypothetical protein
MNDWRKNAKCKGRPVDCYVSENIPKVHPITGKGRVSAARELCADCPVIRECAADAIAEHDTDVVRAGVALDRYGTPVLARQYRRLAKIATGEDRSRADSLLLQRWDGARCSDCGEGVRPRGEQGQSMWPDRPVAANKTTCDTCYKKQYRLSEVSA